jgi:hypothetical protein
LFQYLYQWYKLMKYKLSAGYQKPAKLWKRCKKEGFFGWAIRTEKYGLFYGLKVPRA